MSFSEKIKKSIQHIKKQEDIDKYNVLLDYIDNEQEEHIGDWLFLYLLFKYNMKGQEV